MKSYQYIHWYYYLPIFGTKENLFKIYDIVLIKTIMFYVVMLYPFYTQKCGKDYII